MVSPFESRRSMRALIVHVRGEAPDRRLKLSAFMANPDYKDICEMVSVYGTKEDGLSSSSVAIADFSFKISSARI